GVRPGSAPARPAGGRQRRVRRGRGAGGRGAHHPREGVPRAPQEGEGRAAGAPRPGGREALMLRLPPFTYLEPRTLAEALALRAAAGPDAAYVAGGTDLYPNMKRRQQEPKTVIALAAIAELRHLAPGRLGACVTLTELAESAVVRRTAEVV